MPDKELLEAAARAAGIEIFWSDSYEDPLTEPYVPGPEMGRQDTWNPLTDDGDALRLAVKLQTPVFISMTKARCVWGRLHFEEACDEPITSDACNAARRAIVRAAAEIGKVM